MHTRTPAAAIALALLAGGSSLAAADGVRAGLVPGGFVVERQAVPVRVVLIGFADDVDPATIVEKLPRTSKPVVRFPRSYGMSGRDLGLEYAFDYRVERASPEL